MTEGNGNNGHIFEFGKFVLDPNERILFADGEPVHLTDKVFDTLHLLVRHNGRLLTKEQMMSSIWEESFVEEGNLAKNISRLRKILNVDDTALIETIPRRGYRFAADVRELDGDTSLLVRRNLRVKITQTEDETGRQGEEETARQIGVATKPRSYIPITVGAILFIIVASGLGFYFLKSDAAASTADERIGQNEAGPLRLTNDPANDFWPKWTKDGQIRFYRLGNDKRGRNMLMNPDGTGQTEFALDDIQGYLHYSPDGTKVIYSKPGDKTARYLANADGSNEIVLPVLGNTDWSSDSKTIVYQSGGKDNKNSELYIYSLETGETKNITNDPAYDADPNFSPDGSQVVFASSRDGNAEIYLMNTDGTNVRRLTNDPSWDSHPVFSPDGTTIAFNADRVDENSDVYLMNTEGGDLRRLTSEKSNETVEPGCWSPDGTMIAFFADPDGNDDIFVTSAEVFRPELVLADEKNELQYPSYSPDGRQIVFQSLLPDKSGELGIHDLESGETRVLAKTENADLQPAISPDGLTIAFQNKVESNTEICLISINGGDLTNITQNAAKDASPAFSPDGKQIAFVTNREGNTASFHLYIMNPDGSEPHKVYPKYGLVYSPAWLPGTDNLVFACDKTGTGNFEIYGSSLGDPELERQLTSHKSIDAQPSTSPDGKRIAYMSNADGNLEIYVMNADGTGRLRLTRSASVEAAPHWSPDGNKIIFTSNRSGKFALYTIDLSAS